MKENENQNTWGKGKKENTASPKLSNMRSPWQYTLKQKGTQTNVGPVQGGDRNSLKCFIFKLNNKPCIGTTYSH